MLCHSFHILTRFSHYSCTIQCDINENTTGEVNNLTRDDGFANSTAVNIIPSNAAATENATDSELAETTLNVGTTNGTGAEDDGNMGADEIEIKHFELPSSMIGCSSPHKRSERATC